MAVYCFSDYVFDLSKHSLTFRGQSVAIRPKALKLMAYLIENRHRRVSKSDLMMGIWGSEYTRDYLLFQLVSELRKLPQGSDLIHTQPNEGYQWNIATKEIGARSRNTVIAMAASFVLAALCLVSLISLNSRDIEQGATVQLPAHNALSKGIIALDEGHADTAIEWFEFALAENPESIESSLFLAEALYRNNRVDDSSKHLQTLLNSPNLGSYHKMTISNLMSRIRQDQGRLIDALSYAQQSKQTGVSAQCSVDIAEQRVKMLEVELASQLNLLPPNQPQNERGNVDEKTPPLQDYTERCRQLKVPANDTSSCRPTVNEYIYAANENIIETKNKALKTLKV